MLGTLRQDGGRLVEDHAVREIPEQRVADVVAGGAQSRQRAEIGKC